MLVAMIDYALLSDHAATRTATRGLDEELAAET